MLKKKQHVPKWLHYFIIYTLITFIIGLTIKIVLVVHLFDQSGDIKDYKANANNIYHAWEVSGHRPPVIDHTKWVNVTTIQEFSKELDVLTRQQKEQRTGLILQFIIVLLTLIVYSRSIWDMYKLNKSPDNKYTKKKYRNFKIEYIVFLIIFILIDIYALYLVFKEHPKTGGWLTYTLISLFIPTTMAFCSLLILRKTKPYVVD